MMTSLISTSLAPLLSAPRVCTASSGLRFSAQSMARLSSERVLRFKPGRVQILPQHASVTNCAAPPTYHYVSAAMLVYRGQKKRKKKKKPKRDKRVTTSWWDGDGYKGRVKDHVQWGDHYMLPKLQYLVASLLSRLAYLLHRSRELG